MGKALYRKYRSKSLSEIVGQEHITQALGQAIKTGRISHAYLFTGPRGTGKTSIARILAHQINDLPYTDDSAHMDIIEIDAASNRRIDEIRELREKVYIAPTSARYKVYIIDEVHMLTREAFNALLKTLEEPPAHVVFILATTDAHKLPDTIVSRTQRYSFKPVARQQVIDHLRSIATAEKIGIDDDALGLLAEHGEGTLRDSIGLLDQASNQSSHVTLETVQTMLGMPPAGSLQALLDNLAGKDSGNIVSLVNNLYEQGYQATAIAKQLGQLVRGQLTTPAASLSPASSLQLLAKLLEVPVSHDPERFLEIILLEMTVAPDHPAPAQSVAAPTPAPAKAKAAIELSTIIPSLKEDIVKQATEAPQPSTVSTKSTKATKASPTSLLDEASWPQVLSSLKQTYNTLYGIARMAQPDFSEPDRLTLAFVFAFHQKRLSDPKNRQILADTVEQVIGRHLEIICVLSPAVTPQPVAKTANQPSSQPLDTISNIFGGAELLES